MDKQSNLLVVSFRLTLGLLLVKKLCAVTSDTKGYESIKFDYTEIAETHKFITIYSKEILIDKCVSNLIRRFE